MSRWSRRSSAAGTLVLLALACAPAAVLATVAAGAAAAGPPAAPAADKAAVPARSHLLAAQQQARGRPALATLVHRQCAHTAAPRTADLALQALSQAEAVHRAERALPRPQADRLLQAAVLRGCAAYHATRLQPGASFPVWWHTALRIDGVRPAAAGFEVHARAATSKGPVDSSRVTFSRGLHHACFVSTDATGQAACVMVDTHPHGNRPDGWAEAHEGPVVATFAGSVSATRVELPAVEFRDLPVFASAPTWR